MQECVVAVVRCGCTQLREKTGMCTRVIAKALILFFDVQVLSKKKQLLIFPSGTVLILCVSNDTCLNESILIIGLPLFLLNCLKIC